MTNLYVFVILSFVSLALSWRSLFTVKSHGFYRFFGWECMIWLFSNNIGFWFTNPLSVKQIFSWGLLLIALYLAIVGIILILKRGKPSNSREDKTLFSFEKTTGLVDTGIYRYIRHPLYGSLIYLTWGIYLKNTNIQNLIIAAGASIFLFITSLYDEKECIRYFGDSYKSYMKRSKMFIPYIL